MMADNVSKLGPAEYELIYTLDPICALVNSSQNATCISTVRLSLPPSLPPSSLLFLNSHLTK